jgi:hypothetical protein
MRAQRFLLTVGLLVAVAGAALAQSEATSSTLATPTATPTPFVATNVTPAFGNDQLLTFTYKLQFDCVHQPFDDLNFNGILAESDTEEYQSNICQVGDNPTFVPGGFPNKTAANNPPLYVLIPMFSTDNDTNPADAIGCNVDTPPGTLCGVALGEALISWFGNIPEGFKDSPKVPVQCPNPPSSSNQPGSPPGTCTMHTARMDFGKVLVALKVPNAPTGNVFVPEPNLDNLLNKVSRADINAHWWQVFPVLVNNASDWPTADGSSGITSFKRLQAAVSAKDATIFPSNYFLFFYSVATRGKTQ